MTNQTNVKGMSLHIGLNTVDPQHYSGWNGRLNACENDANDMQAIAEYYGYKTQIILTKEATRSFIINAIKTAAKELEAGDIFFISYSGHGGQLPDTNNNEFDGQDETWCLYDSQLVDDELKALWVEFKAGVRVLVTSDSCHSGTIIKEANNNSIIYSDNDTRFMDSPHALATYIKNKDFYDKVLNEVKSVETSKIKADILQLSGCQDNQYSYDGTFNGTFTAALKRVWNGGQYKGNYYNFHKLIQSLLPSYQSPNLELIGDPEFIKAQPFVIF